jgi:hypothetical protein
VIVAEDEAEAPHEDRGDLFFTTSVEKREPPSMSGTIYTRDNRKDLMSYLGDTPETNFKQAQLIHWLALSDEYRDPSTA